MVTPFGYSERPFFWFSQKLNFQRVSTFQMLLFGDECDVWTFAIDFLVILYSLLSFFQYDFAFSVTNFERIPFTFNSPSITSPLSVECYALCEYFTRWMYALRDFSVTNIYFWIWCATVILGHSIFHLWVFCPTVCLAISKSSYPIGSVVFVYWPCIM